jgi:hypothetical protein
VNNQGITACIIIYIYIYEALLVEAKLGRKGAAFTPLNYYYIKLLNLFIS